VARNQVIVSITGDSKGLQKALGGAVSGLASFGKAAGIAVAAAAGLAAVLSVKAVKAASDLEQAVGGLQSVFKDQFGVMEDFANKAANSVGLAKSEYATLATVLGSQLKNMGVSTDQLAGQTDGLVRMGADLAAQFGGSTSDAVSALSSLLRGERDPIERYGVSINEAAVKAKMAEMGLEGLTGEAEKNAKLQATLALLTQQTADSQGAFTRESDTLAGSLQRLRAKAENLSATYGTALLPAATAVSSAVGALLDAVSNSPVFSAFTASVTTASNQFADWVYGVLTGSKKLSDLKFDFSGIDFSAAIASFTTLRDSIIRQAPSIIRGLIDGLASGASALAAVAGEIVVALVRGITAALPTLLTAAVAIVTGLVNGLTTALPELLTAVADLIPFVIGQILLALPDLIMASQTLFMGLLTGLVEVIPRLIEGLNTMTAEVIPVILGQLPHIIENGTLLFLGLVEAVAIALPQVVDALTQGNPMILDAITAALPQLIDAGIVVFLGLVEAVTRALPQILTAVIAMTPRITATLIQATPLLLAAGLQLFLAIARAIPQALPQVLSGLRSMGPEMAGAVSSLGGQLVGAGVNIIDGLVRGIRSSAGRVTSALTDIAGGAINAFKSMFGIASPSKLFTKFGVFIDQGLANGIHGGMGVVKTAVKTLNSVAVDGFSSTLTGPQVSAAVAGGSYGYTPPVTNNYEVHVHTLNADAETGRTIKESLRAYEMSGGRQ